MLLRRPYRRSVTAGGRQHSAKHRRYHASDLTVAEDAARRIFRVQLRPLQRVAVAAALRGDSFLFVSPTGSGKSVCFQLPAVVQPAGLTTLVVSPLLALMQQQTLALRRLGIDAVELHSGGSGSISVEQLADAASPPRLIYTTPEWLVCHYTRLSGLKVGRLVMDEAHCLSEWGAASGFRSDYLHLGRIRSFLATHAGLESLPVSCFTATASEQVRRDIVQHLGLPPLRCAALPDLLRPGVLEPEPPGIEKHQNSLNVTLLIEADPDRSNLELHVKPAPSGVAVQGASHESERLLIEELGREIFASSYSTRHAVGRNDPLRLPPRTIVFCTTRSDTERIASGLARLLPALMAAGSDNNNSDRTYRGSGGTVSVDVYHSGLSSAARRKSARQWTRGVTRVLVATPAVGLGIDSPDVELILHPTLPPSLASYWQQVGRAGRDGRRARCVLWYSPGDVQRVRHCLQAPNPGLHSLPRGQVDLSAMVAFCTATGCRREVIFQCACRTQLCTFVIFAKLDDCLQSITCVLVLSVNRLEWRWNN